MRSADAVGVAPAAASLRTGHHVHDPRSSVKTGSLRPTVIMSSPFCMIHVNVSYELLLYSVLLTGLETMSTSDHGMHHSHRVAHASCYGDVFLRSRSPATHRL